jgi:hypothetical protein
MKHAMKMCVNEEAYEGGDAQGSSDSNVIYMRERGLGKSSVVICTEEVLIVGKRIILKKSKRSHM